MDGEHTALLAGGSRARSLSTESSESFGSARLDAEEAIPSAAPSRHNPAADNSDFRTYINTVKSFVGVGVLALPFAMSQAGIYAGVLSIIAVMFLGGFTMKILVRTRTKINELSAGPKADSYVDIGMYLFGQTGRWVIAIALAGAQLGTCCAYVIYVAQNLQTLIPGCWSYRLWMLPLLAVFGLLIQTRNFKVLAMICFVGIACVVIACLTILGYGIANFDPSKNFPFARSSYFVALGTIVFASEGINLALPLQGAMKYPHHYERVLDASILTVGLVYVSFAMVGYLTYGDSVGPIITQNLPEGSAVAIFVQTLVMMELLPSYPLQLAPVLTMIEAPLLNNRYLSNKSLLFVEVVRSIVRFLIVVFTVLVAAFLPLFSSVTSLVGSVALTFVGLIVPCVVYIRINGLRHVPIFELVLCAICIVGGGATGGLSTVLTFKQMIHELQHPVREKLC